MAICVSTADLQAADASPHRHLQSVVVGGSRVLQVGDIGISHEGTDRIGACAASHGEINRGFTCNWNTAGCSQGAAIVMDQPPALMGSPNL